LRKHFAFRIVRFAVMMNRCEPNFDGSLGSHPRDLHRTVRPRRLVGADCGESRDDARDSMGGCSDGIRSVVHLAISRRQMVAAEYVEGAAVAPSRQPVASQHFRVGSDCGCIVNRRTAGWWMLVSRYENVSGSVLPDLSQYPWLTTTLAVVMGSIVSPILEQAGFWG
jgi:hypothetical protein